MTFAQAWRASKGRSRRAVDVSNTLNISGDLCERQEIERCTQEVEVTEDRAQVGVVEE